MSSPAAGQVNGPTREELELPSPAQQPRQGAVRVDRDATFRMRCPFADSTLTARIQNVAFTDSTGGELAPALASTLSGITAPQGVQPLAAVCDVRDAANAALRRGGWIATVQIPPQELVDTLQLKVVSARISDVQLTGHAGPFRKLVERRLALLQALDPLNERDVERILLQGNDIPGLGLSLALSPAQGEPGAVIGTVSASYRPYVVYFNARNYGGRQVGRETLFARAEYYGLTGLADRTFIGAQTTADFAEQQVVQAGHEAGLGNLRLAASVTLGWSRPDIGNLDVQTKSVIANLEARAPLARWVDARADLAVGLDLVDQKTVIGPIPLNKDAIRAVYARGTISGAERRLDGSPAITYEGFLEARRGLGVLGASSRGPSGLALTDGISASRPFGDATATIIRAGADLSASLARIFGVRTRNEAQWVSRPLLNYDEFALGNLTIGRGYDPGASSGDRAAGASFEASVIAATPPSVIAQLFAFYDIVRTHNLDFGTPDPTRTLESVGGGIRLSLLDRLQAEAIYARPLDRVMSGDLRRPTDRLLFSLTTKFPARSRHSIPEEKTR